MSLPAHPPKVLRLGCSGTNRNGQKCLFGIPHINYLRNFSRIEWEPELLGLEEIGMGFSPTLVAAPGWALAWLKSVECTKKSFWDVPLVSRAPFDVWSHLPPAPAGLVASEGFVREGGFVNVWTERHATHVVWGKLREDCAASILAFVWLQNVLAGGRHWRRHELGRLPEQFKKHLALGYLHLGLPNEPVEAVSLGLPRPILRRKDGELFYAGDWIGVHERTQKVTRAQLGALVLPELEPCLHERLLTFGKNEKPSDGVVWCLEGVGGPGMLALYSSAIAARVDHMQDTWERWMNDRLGMMDADKRSELLLCVREAVINADEHGCRSVRGHRFLMAMQNFEKERRVRVRVSDPGLGHAHDVNSMMARQDQMMGRHLGLKLIHGIAQNMSFARHGATLQFDFHY